MIAATRRCKPAGVRALPGTAPRQIEPASLVCLATTGPTGGWLMRKALLCAAAVLVTAGGLTSSAGAAAQTSAAPARLSTQAAAAKYLRSLGIDPAGVVVQRGSKNYAGPSCPGAGWNCTKATRVLQISGRAGAAS